MSNYSENMVAEMEKIGSFNYDSAAAFAEKYSDADISTRSVISKIKSLGLEYTPRVAAKAAPRLRKSDMVISIADAIGVHPDELDGLSNAKTSALSTLLAHIG